MFNVRHMRVIRNKLTKSDVKNIYAYIKKYDVDKASLFLSLSIWQHDCINRKY